MSIQAFAQFPPREDDHFWRRKVVNRIDLTEKINRPLVQREGSYYAPNETGYTENEGLIMALFNGLKKGKFVAYKTDSLETAMGYDAVMARLNEIDGASEGEEDFDDGFGEEDEGFDDFGGEDDFGEFDFGDEFGDEFDDGFDDLGGGGGAAGGDFDPSAYEMVVQFVEDRIFDKTRSDMVYDIEYIEVIWVDPGETLPEKPVAVFKYKDAMETLDNTQWKNRFNDAEYRSLREVFELRMFNSYIIDVSGQGVKSLEEAEYRRQQLVEFEHHLWSY